MAIKTSFKSFFILSLTCLRLYGYEVYWPDTLDDHTLQLLKSNSQLEKLKDKSPPTETGLRRRTENDLVNMTKVLQSLGYFNSSVQFEINKDQANVSLLIETGPLFTISNFVVILTPKIDCINLDDYILETGSPALPEKILGAEENLLDVLNRQGYAFAQVTSREVIADQTSNQVEVVLQIELDRQARFGEIKLKGLERVNPCYFYKKQHWQQGEIYDPLKIKTFQESLELSGLFRSVHISHAESPHEGDLLPIEIEVIEAKQRTIGLGLSYISDLGAGVSGEWEDRNVGGEGQQLTFRADLWERLQEAKLSYVLPDFGGEAQRLINLIDYQYEDIRAFSESAFSLSSTLEKDLNKNTTISYGWMYKYIRSFRSNNNRSFDLIKFPFSYRWSNANCLLNPTKGYTLNVKLIPSLQFLAPVFAYSINTATGTFYHSLTGDDRAVFAGKLMCGSIFGANKHDIPPPERFYAGSETTLRGYNYLTVSPLGHDHKPIGGRSLLVASMEMRFRTSGNLGWSLFYDVGNVYSSPLPTLKEGALQAVGVGIHYHTLIGPLRLDLAFPLNRRPHLDGPVQIYFSIGQSF